VGRDDGFGWWPDRRYRADGWRWIGYRRCGHGRRGRDRTNRSDGCSWQRGIGRSYRSDGNYGRDGGWLYRVGTASAGVGTAGLFLVRSHGRCAGGLCYYYQLFAVDTGSAVVGWTNWNGRSNGNGWLAWADGTGWIDRSDGGGDVALSRMVGVMANIDFPANPTIGQTYTFAGVTYTFTSHGMWITLGGGPAGPTGPAGPSTPSSINPLMDNIAAPGVATAYSREDHIHPSDTSRMAKAGDTMTGNLTVNLNPGPAPPLPNPSGGFNVVGADSVPTGVSVDTFANNGAHVMRRANGSAAAPTRLSNADAIGNIVWRGYDAVAGYSATNTAVMSVITSEDWVDTNHHGSRLFINLTPIGSGAPQTVLQVYGSGGMSIGPGALGAPDPGAGALSAPGGIKGTATNDNAAAGMVGEYIVSSIGSGAAIPVTSGAQTAIVSIILTPGDWDVSGVGYFVPTPTTSVQYVVVSDGPTTTIGGALSGFGQVVYSAAGVVIGGVTFSVPCGPTRQSLAVTTTIYLTCLPSFTASTMTAYGVIRARRVR
jgi:hypothetical protein